MKRRVAVGALVAATAAVLGGAGAGYAATADDGSVIRTKTPRTADDITNLDVVHQQIRNYYEDPDRGYWVGPHSNYTKEVAGVVADASRYLAAHKSDRGKKAIVLDVDDTLLSQYNFLSVWNWYHDPAIFEEYAKNNGFDHIPAMVDLVNKAKSQGYAIFYVSERTASLEQPTLANLTQPAAWGDPTFPEPTALSNGEDGLFTKPDGDEGTSSKFKATTRKHIESLGYDIVANIGDQESDLKGGYANRTFKLPNPMYLVQ